MFLSMVKKIREVCELIHQNLTIVLLVEDGARLHVLAV